MYLNKPLIVEGNSTELNYILECPGLEQLVGASGGRNVGYQGIAQG